MTGNRSQHEENDLASRMGRLAEGIRRTNGMMERLREESGKLCATACRIRQAAAALRKIPAVESSPAS